VASGGGKQQTRFRPSLNALCAAADGEELAQRTNALSRSTCLRLWRRTKRKSRYGALQRASYFIGARQATRRAVCSLGVFGALRMLTLLRASLSFHATARILRHSLAYGSASPSSVAFAHRGDVFLRALGRTSWIHLISKTVLSLRAFNLRRTSKGGRTDMGRERLALRRKPAPARAAGRGLSTKRAGRRRIARSR